MDRCRLLQGEAESHGAMLALKSPVQRLWHVADGFDLATPRRGRRGSTWRARPSSRARSWPPLLRAWLRPLLRLRGTAGFLAADLPDA